MADKRWDELHKGAWSSSTSYTIGDFVSHNGSSYTCIANHTNQEPPNSSYWALIAQGSTDAVNAHAALTSTHGVSGNIVGTTDTQTLTNKTLTTPKIGTSINDTNGNEVIKTPATTSAVNEITVTNAATGNAPEISATGDDTNIDLSITGKGSGGVMIKSKRRVTSITSSSTPTPNADTTDDYIITALAENATFGAPSGTPTQGQGLVIRIKDNGTARTLSWNSAYRAMGASLPTTTTTNKTMYIGFKYNSTDGKWDCLVVNRES